VAQQLIVTAAIYFRLFAPQESWRLAGRELACQGCRFDLVFQSQDAEVFTEEIKTGRLDYRLERQSLDEQVARELAAGKKEWDERFLGVRTVVLGAPRKSLFFDPKGHTSPVRWDGVL